MTGDRKRRIQTALHAELALAQSVFKAGDAITAFTHLQRAHVLAQLRARWHVRVHWAMLCWAWRTRNAREWRGQCLRIIFAAPSSWLRAAPRGNNGGTNMALRATAPVPPDLEVLLRE